MNIFHYQELYEKWSQDAKKIASMYQTPVTSKKFRMWVYDLQVRYPQIQIRTLAYTISGNEIIEVRVGEGPVQLHLNAGMHANESICTNLLMAFISQYLFVLYCKSEDHSEFHRMFCKFTLSFVPLINPDGIDLLYDPKAIPYDLYERALQIGQNCIEVTQWKANICGVDLNNQFPAVWEKIFTLPFKVNKPAPRDFPGYAPLTENEALALYDLVYQNQFQAVLCLHTQGEEFYWGFLDYEPDLSQIQAELFEAVSGYRAVRTIESYGGFKDWFILTFQKPGFTIEVGSGINPLPLSDFEVCRKKVNELLFSYLFFYV